MIQDIEPHVFANHYDPAAQADPGEPVLVIRKEKVLCRILEEEERQQDPEAFSDAEQIHDGTGRKLAEKRREVMEFPAFGEEGFSGIAKEDLTYLFTIDTTDFFLYDVTDEDGFEVPEGYAFFSLHELRERNIGPKVREFASMTGMHLAHWYRNNRYCGHCGTNTVKDTVERALVCPHCGNRIYPRIVPAVIVGVLNPEKNKILVTKYRRGYSHFALVAGFTEIGESLEGTVRREVMEETGLRVRNIRYYKSQPWGIVDDILAGFYCDVDGDDAIKMDPGELKVAQWVGPGEVELQPEDFSLTNEMMAKFKEGKL